MKTYFKTFLRMFRHHVTRLISIFMMVLISVGFSAGVGMGVENISYAGDMLYRNNIVSDIIVKNTSAFTFEDSQLQLLADRFGEENMLVGGSLEAMDGKLLLGEGLSVKINGLHPAAADEYGTAEEVTRIYFFQTPLNDMPVNKFTFLQNFDAEGDSVFYSERATRQLHGFEQGETLSVDIPQVGKLEVTCAGTVQGALHFAEREDIAWQADENGEQRLLNDVVYIVGDNPVIGMIRNDVYIALPHDNEVMSHEHKQQMADAKAEIKQLLGDGVEVLTLEDNFSFRLLDELVQKITLLSYVLVAVFLLVTLLVVLTTVMRMLDEERDQIACLTTLGFSPAKIIFKYILFAAVAIAVGVLGAYFVGQGVSSVVYINFGWCFALPDYPYRASTIFFVIASLCISVGTLAATFFSGLRMTRTKPAILLRPKAPKAGKRILLERIGIIWNHVSFKYKSMLRNLFRYKIRCAMTVVAIAVSSALTFAGFAVLDCCLFQDVGTEALIGMSVVVLAFAVLLDAVIIYTLTTINVSERKRELATLMVLGYNDKEVPMYVFREIYLLSALGMVLGIPVGLLLCFVVFWMLDFGAIDKIGWYAYICAPMLTLLFTLVVSALLTPRIRRIDMNESLKSGE